ncbi:MAG: hypothetical protein WDA33_09250, partial [Alcaligenes sp.]
MSVTGLFVFIWSLRRNFFDHSPAASREIFSKGEIGQVDDPSATPEQRQALQEEMGRKTISAEDRQALSLELAERVEADRSTASVTFILLACSVFWLLFASTAGLISSIKLHDPEFLTQHAWMTFGRMRT